MRTSTFTSVLLHWRGSYWSDREFCLASSKQNISEKCNVKWTKVKTNTSSISPLKWLTYHVHCPRDGKGKVSSWWHSLQICSQCPLTHPDTTLTCIYLFVWISHSAILSPMPHPLLFYMTAPPLVLICQVEWPLCAGLSLPVTGENRTCGFKTRWSLWPRFFIPSLES